MQQREKILAGAVLLLLVLWQGRGPFDSLFVKPLRDREQKISKLEGQIGAKKTRQNELLRSQKQFKEWATRSLPPDPLIASTMYQNWLIELASKSKLSQVSVVPSRMDPKPKGDTYYSVTATVKAEASLSRLCDFLYELRQSGLLHRVNSMTVEAARHEGDPTLDVTLVIEGLALTNSPVRTTLLSEGLASLRDQIALPKREDYAPFEKKHLFVRGYKDPTPPPTDSVASRPPTTPVENIDAAEHVYLVASLARGDARDAWLYDRTANKKSLLVEGESFQAAGIDGTVTSIGSDFVVLKIGDDEWRLELGQNLRQIKKMPGT